MDPYLLLKTIHILSATLLLGTGLGIAFFCWFGYRYALRHADIGALRVVTRLTVIADAISTAPAVVIQFVTGILLMLRAGWSLTSPWAITVYALFVLVGVCWLPVVWIQARLARIAETAPAMDRLPPDYGRLFLIWFVLGWPAFAGVIVLVWMMVAKPLPVV